MESADRPYELEFVCRAKTKFICSQTIRVYNIKVREQRQSTFQEPKSGSTVRFHRTLFSVFGGAQRPDAPLLRSDIAQSLTREVRTMSLPSFKRAGVVAPKMQLALRL